MSPTTSHAFSPWDGVCFPVIGMGHSHISTELAVASSAMTEGRSGQTGFEPAFSENRLGSS